MDNKTIDQLLSSLSALVGDARGSLFGQDKCMVDRDQLLYLVDTLQTQLPAEIEEARTIIDNCSMLRANAQKDAADTRKEADRILREAETLATKLVEEHTITDLARKQEQEILEKAHEQRDQLIDGAIKYADSLMEEIQQAASAIFEPLCAGIDALQQQVQADQNDVMQKISEARDALHNAVKEP